MDCPIDPGMSSLGPHCLETCRREVLTTASTATIHSSTRTQPHCARKVGVGDHKGRKCTVMASPNCKNWHTAPAPFFDTHISTIGFLRVAKRKRSWWLFLAVVITMTIMGCSSKTRLEKEILGTWTGPNMIPYEFQPDGKMTWGGMDMSYKILDAKRMRVSLRDTRTGQPVDIVYTVRIRGDRLRLTNTHDGSTAEYVKKH